MRVKDLQGPDPGAGPALVVSDARIVDPLQSFKRGVTRSRALSAGQLLRSASLADPRLGLFELHFSELTQFTPISLQLSSLRIQSLRLEC